MSTIPRDTTPASTTDCGSYLLLIRVSKKCRVAVGRLGTIAFPRGWYVYAGSAMRGLSARLARHRRAAKKLHWHIDYLLASPPARLVECRAYHSATKLECRLNRAVLALGGARPAARGFGSSDCSQGCEAHLTYFTTKPDLAALPFSQRKEKRDDKGQDRSG